jgi:hypothetical protein
MPRKTYKSQITKHKNEPSGIAKLPHLAFWDWYFVFWPAAGGAVFAVVNRVQESQADQAERSQEWAF